MFKKGSIFYSIFHNKCPRCQEGDVYVDSNPYHFKNLFKMYEKCSVCGLKYEKEPSFFHGAMYVSYAMTVALFIAVFVICQLLGVNLKITFIAIVITLIVMIPITFKVSRLIYMNFFESYDPKYAQKTKENEKD
ncbi:MAG TPA: DUF983 domain-containing protein [Flavobacteriia bacterium]|nr:DUF983 domain-containing protein [Flavobacteriia bacterium]